MSYYNKQDAAGKSSSGIEYSNVREDVPEWGRVYRAKLDNRCQIEVTIWDFLGRRSGATLTQPNGNSISFDIDRVADKIIDPILVPLVERAVSEIKSLDKQYIHSDRSQFIDENGDEWMRK